VFGQASQPDPTPVLADSTLLRTAAHTEREAAKRSLALLLYPHIWAARITDHSDPEDPATPTTKGPPGGGPYATVGSAKQIECHRTTPSSDGQRC
jgi:hypothetical protein